MSSPYTPPHRPLWFYHLMAFTTVLIWSFSFLFIVWINEDLDALGVVVMRKAIFAVLVLGLLIWRRPNVFKLTAHQWWLIVGLALVSGPLYHSVFAWSASKGPGGADRISSALLGLIMATVPIYASFLGWLFLREKLTLAKLTALALGSGGVIFVIIGRFGRIDLLPREHLEGPLGVTAAAIVGGGIVVLTRANRKVFGPFDLVAVSGAIIVLMSMLLIPWAGLERVPEMSLRGWCGIVFLGLGGSGVAFLTWATALRGLQAGTAAMYLFLASILGALWAWMFRGQSVSWAFIPGSTMVLAGLLIMARAGARAQLADAAIRSSSAQTPGSTNQDDAASKSPDEESLAPAAPIVACHSEIS